jgi:hypothetical protein
MGGFFLSPKDEQAIERICELPLKIKQLLVVFFNRN